MSKVELPKPSAWLHVCRKKTQLRALLYEKDAPELKARGFTPEPLFTQCQSEAYAAAKVAEALEEAAGLCDLHSRMFWNCDRKAQAKLLRDLIREQIPK